MLLSKIQDVAFSEWRVSDFPASVLALIGLQMTFALCSSLRRRKSKRVYHKAEGAGIEYETLNDAVMALLPSLGLEELREHKNAILYQVTTIFANIS